MLESFTCSLQIRLSRKRVTILRTAGWPLTRTSLVIDAHMPEGPCLHPERFSQALSVILKQRQCSRLATRLVLSDELVRLFMVTPPKNIERLADCEAATAMRFQTLYDEAPTNWKISADRSVHHPFLACAMPKGLLKALKESCAKHCLKLIEIQPQFIDAYNRSRDYLNQSTWLASIHHDGLVLGAFEHRRLHAVRSIPSTNASGDNEQWLSEHIKREAMRLDLPTPEKVYVTGELPGNWTTRKMGALTFKRIAEPFWRSDLAGVVPSTAQADLGEPA